MIGRKRTIEELSAGNDPTQIGFRIIDYFTLYNFNILHMLYTYVFLALYCGWYVHTGQIEGTWELIVKIL